VTLLLDTHTLLWFLRDDPLLSAAAKALIQSIIKTPSTASSLPRRPLREFRSSARTRRSTPTALPAYGEELLTLNDQPRPAHLEAVQPIEQAGVNALALPPWAR